MLERNFGTLRQQRYRSKGELYLEGYFNARGGVSIQVFEKFSDNVRNRNEERLIEFYDQIMLSITNTLKITICSLGKNLVEIKS